MFYADAFDCCAGKVRVAVFLTFLAYVYTKICRYYKIWSFVTKDAKHL